jgi:hypothetical protein
MDIWLDVVVEVLREKEGRFLSRSVLTGKKKTQPNRYSVADATLSSEFGVPDPPEPTGPVARFSVRWFRGRSGVVCESRKVPVWSLSRSDGEFGVL